MVWRYHRPASQYPLVFFVFKEPSVYRLLNWSNGGRRASSAGSLDSMDWEATASSFAINPTKMKTLLKFLPVILIGWLLLVTVRIGEGLNEDLIGIREYAFFRGDDGNLPTSTPVDIPNEFECYELTSEVYIEDGFEEIKAVNFYELVDSENGWKSIVFNEDGLYYRDRPYEGELSLADVDTVVIELLCVKESHVLQGALYDQSEVDESYLRIWELVE